MSEETKNALLREVVLGTPPLFFYSLNRYPGVEIKPFLHQIHLLYHAVMTRPVRLLIGDEIGLGKTIEALAIARYLELRGEVKRILVLVPKILLKQWESEVKRVGGIPRVVKSGADLERELRFSNGKYIIISIDLAKRTEHARKILDVDWDLVIVDEAHNVTLGTQRYELVRKLAEKKERHLLLLSATPHRGDPKDYLARLRLIDPTLVEDYGKLHKPGFYKRTHDTILFRRTKRIVNNLEGKEIFKGCEFRAVVVDVDPEEKEYYEKLEGVLEEMVRDSEKYSVQALLAVLLRKRASSSIQAALKTLTKIVGTASEPPRYSQDEINNYLSKLFAMSFDEIELEEYEDEIDNIVYSILEKYSGALSTSQRKSLEEIIRLGYKVSGKDSKVKALANIIATHLKNGEKVVVFTEYVDTLEHLKEALPKYLRENGIYLRDDEILTISGKDKGDFSEINERLKRDAMVLISTDVASEGLNLQVASVVINYEAPWSPIKLEQRIGRVWRLGQERETTAYIMFLSTSGDRDVLQNLYSKIMNIQEGTGAIFDTLQFEEYVYLVDEKGKKVSEYDLIYASLKKQLGSYTEALVRTIASLKNALERNQVFPTAKSEEIRQELSKLLFDEKYLKQDKIEELAKKYENILRIIFVDKGGVIPPRLFIASDVPQREYLYFVALRDTSGNVLYRFPVIVSIENGKPVVKKKGFEVFKYLMELFSGEVLPAPKPRQKELPFGMEGLVKKIGRETFYSTIVRKYLESYESQLGSLKQGRLFREVYVDVELGTVLEYVPREEFNLYKVVPVGLLDILGLDKEKIAAPRDKDLLVLERNFVPTEEIFRMEKKAMDIVMNLEAERLARKFGADSRGKLWDVEDVSLREHYDVYVWWTENGVRKEKYIEVKGHGPLILFAELTEKEKEFAEQHKEDYVLYLVANIKTKPVILRIHNLFDGAERRVFLLKDGLEVDITTRVDFKVDEKRRYVIGVSM
ncbi:hypothetical protein OCC_04300 [Thermococcus litoralis DSM 5473]|uniref:DUF3883 domain-containing protein n=1 Tax=Thermococcus litoralis (strain ATCC 51850 / DSM 5473 / JCM 8560 / NS-C) TaxID=523849 RepID=H3ZPK5_THELN|nr:helicase-related protein [Thermococcus litoralis]EHR78049.1 hypothetical protein OCC_04300 [Thermococcus litoralis DSM 5473]